jgi:hypothetical protein
MGAHTERHRHVKKREKNKDTKTTKTANTNLTTQQLEAVCGAGGDGRSYVTGY